MIAAIDIRATLCVIYELGNPGPETIKVQSRYKTGASEPSWLAASRIAMQCKIYSCNSLRVEPK